MSPLEVVGAVLLGAGALFVISGGAGLLRFPDFYTRNHAVGITDSVGAGFILTGLMLQPIEWPAAVRLLIILLFLTITGPTAAHILAHAARRDGVPVWQAGDPRQ